MFYHQPVHRADAQKVLFHLSTLLHKVYTLSTVAVSLIDEDCISPTLPDSMRRESGIKV